MVNPQVVRRKLIKMDGYLKELQDLQGYAYSEYLSNNLVRRSAERLLQLLVDVAADINTHVIVDEDFAPPSDYYTSFIKAGEVGLLPGAFAARLAPAAGERNILVHDYENINNKIVFDSIPIAVQMFGQYIGYVEDFLRRREGVN